MKRARLIIGMAAVLVCFGGCGKDLSNANGAEKVAEAASEEVTAEGEMEEDSIEARTGLDVILDKVKNVENKEYAVNAMKGRGDEAYDVTVEGESGTVGWAKFHDDSVMVVVDYLPDHNCFNIMSYVLNENNELKAVSTEMFSGLRMGDNCRIFISKNKFPNGSEGIIVENITSGFTFGDGVIYGADVIEVTETGGLLINYEDKINGQFLDGANIFYGINLFTGFDYSAEDLEEGDYLHKQEGGELIAEMDFTSDVAKMILDGNAEGEGSNAFDILAPVINDPNASVPWGKAEIISYSEN